MSLTAWVPELHPVLAVLVWVALSVLVGWRFGTRPSTEFDGVAEWERFYGVFRDEEHPS